MEKRTEKQWAFLDVLISNAVEKVIVKKDLTSNSDVYQIVDEVAERLRYPVTGGRYGCENNIEKKIAFKSSGGSAPICLGGWEAKTEQKRCPNRGQMPKRKKTSPRPSWSRLRAILE